MRRIEPVAGLPRIAIRVRPDPRLRPADDQLVVGSNHIRYVGGAQVMRLTTDAPLSYIVDEITFPLTRPLTLIFGQDEPFLSAIDTTAANSWSGRATIGSTGCATSRCRSNGRRR